MPDLFQRVASLTDDQRRTLANRLSGSRAGSRLRAFVTLRPGASITPEELREYLQERLPPHAIPSNLEILDSLPRLPNGKLDRRALAARHTAVPTSSLSQESGAPRSEREQALLSIWQEVLGTTEITIRDDFFEIGGDSILSIQVVSRARAAGVRISPGDLADHPTIAQLAAVPGTDPTPVVTEHDDSQPFPLTPIQRWFFGLNLAQPTQWNQAAFLRIAPGLGSQDIEAAVQAVALHHPQLRAGIKRDPDRDEWIQVTHPDPPALALHSAQPTEFAPLLQSLQESFRFDGSPLAAFAYIQSERLLVVCAHHLVIDKVSWDLFLSDLETALHQASSGIPILLSDKSATYASWARKLAAQEHQPNAQEISYWTSSDPNSHGRLPLDHPPQGILVEAESKTYRATLSPPLSQRLIKESNAAYNTRVDELLLVPLVMTLAELTGKNRLRIGLERHGRDALDDAIDPGRTIGWFTTYYPLRTHLENAADLGATIKSLKEQLRAIPRHGVGYGQLRYGEDASLANAISSDEDTEDVLFNYLGSIPSRPSFEQIESVEWCEAGCRAPENRRSHLLEINCFQQDGALHLNWTFNTKAHHPATIERWAGLYLQHLEKLIDHCSQDSTVGYTPSDFPEAEMSQEELDDFLEQL